jgi:RES domain-containing protein
VTPLPAALGTGEVVAWRLDPNIFETTWDSGEGSFQAGGRWNSKGVRAVYCSFDPATTILEVAVHKSFKTLDVVPHILTSLTISDPAAIHVVEPRSVPNPNWLWPGIPSAGQQTFGDDLLSKYPFLALPSVVSTNSWNLVFVGAVAAARYAVRTQERFALDPRLHPPHV